MYYLYQLLKQIVRFALWLYYPKTEVANKKALRIEGPAIFVSNHPNTLGDPLNVGARTKEQLYFLANAGLFKTPFSNWFFNTFYCIPIKRKQDAGKAPVNNDDSFDRCNTFLANGGCLFIAPEGDSWVKRPLQKLKTGTARIALSAAAQQNFELDICIVPVGLNYESPIDFRTGLFVNVGEPIRLDTFQKSYEEEPFLAARKITDLLEERMQSLLLHPVSEEEDELLLQLERLLRNEQRLSPQPLFHKLKHLQKALRALSAEEPAKYQEFKEQLLTYSKGLEEAGLTDQGVAEFDKGAWKTNTLAVLLGLPFYLFGILGHIIPMSIIEVVFKKMKLYIGYRTTARLLGGLFLYPLFYWLQSELVEVVWGTNVAWWYLLSLPISGIFAALFYDYFKRWYAALKVWRKPKKREELLAMRTLLWQQTEDLSDSSLNDNT